MLHDFDENYKKRVNHLFGYVLPYKGELKVRELEVFQAYYCGLCKTMGKEFNQAVRFSLSYDMTFLALLLSSLDELHPTTRTEGCIAHPLKKKLIIDTNDSLLYSSNISILLIYFKLLDNWYDDKSLISLTASTVFLMPSKKVRKLYPQKYDRVKTILQDLSQLEKENCNNVDKSADLFAKIMEEITVPPFITDPKTTRVLRWLGYNLGRWIYILDAFSDIKDDIKNGNYNSILLQYNYLKEEAIEDFISRVKEPIEFSLTFTLDNMAKSYELLDIKHNKGILDNIFYMGTRRKMDQVFLKQEDNNIEKSI